MIDPLRGRPELARLRRGVEKESLRVMPSGALAPTPHPAALGSALTHPHITTDFSEAQPELITGVHDGADACIAELEDIHRFVYRHLDEELLWAASMPCILADDADIPVGRYGTSNVGRAKTVYRLGLGHRYGRLMQTISGIHYNFSIPDALWPAVARVRDEALDDETPTRAYFDLIRNFRRQSWLLLYLFGASPAVCKSFVKGTAHGLASFDEGSLYLPHATTLRMGPLGYQSDAQASLHVSYNSLADYGATIHDALARPYPPYAAIGLQNARGAYQQLGTGLLQIENEFYGAIRPKRRTRSGERPIAALRERGVEYVEVRCLDLNPFLRVGIDAHAMRFMDVFLLHCLLAESPPDSPEESERMQENQRAIVERGREPGLTLADDTRRRDRSGWANEILDGCAAIADAIDEVAGNDLARYAVELQKRKVADPENTPSARILATMRVQRQPFFRFAMNQSVAHRGYFDEHPMRAARLASFEVLTRKSLADQERMEAANTESFDDYVARQRLDTGPA